MCYLQLCTLARSQSPTFWLTMLPDPGDPVNEDDVLVQIETDKVTIDVRYTESQPGTLKEYLVKADDTVTVGQEVCVVAKGEVSEGAHVALLTCSLGSRFVYLPAALLGCPFG